MPKGNTLSRLMIASLTAMALAAPAAVAQPIDMHQSTSPDPQPATWDQRTEASKFPAYASPAPKPGQDLRSEAAADPSRKPAPSFPRALPGPPTWPMHPAPIATAPGPVADGGDGGNGGIDLPVALIGIAGTLALGGGLTVVALRHRARVAH
jgi:hypothetical protein